MVPGTGTDQTSNFQAAIDAAQSQALPLYIPKGEYHITTVSITQPVEIYSSPGAAAILGYNQAPLFDVSPSDSTPFGPVHISGLLIDGENQSFPVGIGDPALIKLSQINYLTIEDASFATLPITVSICSSAMGGSSKTASKGRPRLEFSRSTRAETV
jgi:hypothetical protein